MQRAAGRFALADRPAYTVCMAARKSGTAKQQGKTVRKLNGGMRFKVVEVAGGAYKVLAALDKRGRLMQVRHTAISRQPATPPAHVTDPATASEIVSSLGLQKSAVKRAIERVNQVIVQ